MRWHVVPERLLLGSDLHVTPDVGQLRFRRLCLHGVRSRQSGWMRDRRLQMRRWAGLRLGSGVQRRQLRVQQRVVRWLLHRQHLQPRHDRQRVRHRWLGV